jgi:quinol monooxygenase YgiN
MMATPEPVLLVAVFEARPDTLDELRERLLEMVELTNREPGCVQYELHTYTDRPLAFAFVETWVDQAALDLHDQTAHVRAIRADADRLTRRPIDVHRLRRIAPDRHRRPDEPA